MPSVLIVDDNTQETKRISKEMENQGYKVYSTYTGATGIASAIKSVPDLILLDLVLPDMTGFSVCRLLRNNIKTAHIPVIMLTVRETVQDKVDGFGSGANDYIIKPYDLNELYARVAACIRVSEERNRLIHSNKIIKKNLFDAVQLSIVDTVTGLFNRRYSNNILAHEFIRFQRYGALFSLMVIDIDLFKPIPHAVGEDQGAATLRELASVIQSQIRDIDILSRWREDEFAVILPQSSYQDAVHIASRILKEIGQYPFSNAVNLKNPITASIGIGGLPNKNYLHSFQVVAATDIALIRAKKKGQNQIEVATDEDIGPLIPIP